MMILRGSTKIVNFMTPGVGWGGGGVLKLCIILMACSIYSTLIAFVLRGYIADFLSNC